VRQVCLRGSRDLQFDPTFRLQIPWGTPFLWGEIFALFEHRPAAAFSPNTQLIASVIGVPQADPLAGATWAKLA